MLHIYPTDDYLPHKIDVTDCHCEPHIEYVDKETRLPHMMPLVIHNAFDEREGGYDENT